MDKHLVSDFELFTSKHKGLPYKILTMIYETPHITIFDIRARAKRSAKRVATALDRLECFDFIYSINGTYYYITFKGRYYLEYLRESRNEKLWNN